MKWQKLLLIGDSNTQFGFSKQGTWVSLLADYLQRKCDVINRGFSGYNTEHIYRILPELLEEFHPDSTCGVILMLGSNDSADHETSPIQHIPLDRYVHNLELITKYITETWGLNKNKLIIINPPKIDDEKWKSIKKEQNCVSSHYDKLVSEYGTKCAEFAIHNNYKLVNLNRAMFDQGDSFKDLLFDGLHFSTKGGQFLFDLLKSIVDITLIDDLKYNYPYWKDINLEKISQY
jgi:isoamyl acetate esterase